MTAFSPGTNIFDSEPMTVDRIRELGKLYGGVLDWAAGELPDVILPQRGDEGLRLVFREHATIAMPADCTMENL